jgi:hypothetical protein
LNSLIHTGELPSNIDSLKRCAASDIALGTIAKKVRAYAVGLCGSMTGAAAVGELG